jgi:hypothetical protein
MTNTKLTRDADHQRALECIRELAQHGHAFGYIAKALSLRGIPTPSGHTATWHKGAVSRIAKAHGIAARYRRAA